MKKVKLNPTTFEEMEVAFNKYVKFGQCNQNGTCDTSLLKSVANELRIMPIKLARNEDFRWLVTNRYNEE